MAEAAAAETADMTMTTWPPMRVHQTFMKFTLTLIALTLLLTGCNRDATLSRKIVGTWQADSSMTEEFRGDGSFLFSKRNSNQTNDFSGEWQIKNGFLILSLKNATGPSSLLKYPVFIQIIFLASPEKFPELTPTAAPS